jgi:NAD(P)H-dependent FMN reductase
VIVKPKLIVLVASTRPGRVGSTVGQWFAKLADEHGAYDVELVELEDMNLPLFNEPHHPAMGKYVHEHTKDWSAKVDGADAFVFVTPEYNFGTPPSLTNALTYLVNEWKYKPVGFASYGGISGGIRSVQDTKLALTTFKMVPMYEAVVIPNVGGELDDNGTFVAKEIHDQSANAMLDELLRWTNALASLRN